MLDALELEGKDSTDGELEAGGQRSRMDDFLVKDLVGSGDLAWVLLVSGSVSATSTALTLSPTRPRLCNRVKLG